MVKPYVNLNPPANRGTADNELIIDFRSGGSPSIGGSISFVRHDDGRLTVNVHGVDDRVEVTGERAAVARSAMRQRTWVETPRVRQVPVNHGKGKSVVSGVVDIAFIGKGRASITTDAHVNDHKPAVDFRGESWLIHVFAERTEAGEWVLMDERGSHSVHITRRQNWSDAPPSYVAPLVAAVLAIVPEHWTPEVDRAAEYADAAQRLHTLEPERDKAAEDLADMDRRVASLRARMDAAKADRA